MVISLSCRGREGCCRVLAGTNGRDILRSSSNLIVEPVTIPKRRNHRHSKQIVEPEFRTIVETPVTTMADARTMSELLQAPTEGYVDAIVIPAILADNFELKITSTLKYRNVSNEAIKLMLFPFSLDEVARIWLEKEPPRSILTWEDLGCFKDLLRKCPHHGFSKLHQIDTFYNALTQSDQDSLDAAAGGNILNHTPRDALTIIENKSKVRISQNKPVVSKVSTITSSPSPSPDVTALTEIVKELVLMNKATQQANVKAIEKTCVTCGGPHPYFQILILKPEVVPKPNPKPSIPYPSRLNNQKLQEKTNNQMMRFLQIFQRLHFDLSFDDAFLHMPKFASTFKSLLSNKEKLFELASTPLNKNWSAKKLSLLELTPTRMTLELANRPIAYPVGVAEDVFVKVGKFHLLADFVVVDYDVDPRVPLILERPFLRMTRALIDTFHVRSMLKKCLDSQIARRVEISLLRILSLLLLPPHLSPNLPPMKNEDLKKVDVTMTKPSIEEPSELELKDLPSHFEYAFLEGTNKLPVIIAKEFKDEEKAALLKVLKSHKQAITWKISNIKDIDPLFCTHKILIKDDFKPAVQHQRRVNPKIHEVIKKEVIKLLDAGLIYPISDSPWVSPVHCVPKKGGMTVVKNEDNELIPTRLVTGWRVCIDYRKLNDATLKDHFPLPFMDQMLERLVGNEYYCFLDGFSRYFQIPVDPKGQEKTTFTCPYGTFTYRCMPFGLCNASGTF
uniref:Reverse transcriptase domain-containing protein n=1 Tax=Tanacetum cinerariifolium TaxID=118510 RepID=A0A6L2MF76_TANCI|nr:reverse transcriptase domain-containing protein [Tanacetum cinerariifolium]